MHIKAAPKLNKKKKAKIRRNIQSRGEAESEKFMWKNVSAAGEEKRKKILFLIKKEENFPVVNVFTEAPESTHYRRKALSLGVRFCFLSQ
jgi:tRNA/tmRNA/rRNA uracil-C5-methylase (TrmA/RlmC/RlmD family)